MKRLFTFIALTYSLVAGVNTSYERNNEDVQNIVPKLLKGITSISLSPVQSESKALYQLSHSSSTVMSLCYSTTLENIQAHTQEDKLLKYMLVTPVHKGEVHLIVARNSRLKTVYDLERHNIGMGLEGSSTHLIGQSLFLDADISVREFNYTLNESMRRLIGGGLDAVVAIGKAPIQTLKNYQGKFKLISIPATGSHRNTNILGHSYGLSMDTMTLSGDLLLIAKKDALHSSTPLWSKTIRNLLFSKDTDVNALCSDNGHYGLSVFRGLKSACTEYQNQALSRGDKKVVIALDLLRQSNSLDEIEIYNDALRHGMSVGGLNFNTESSKLQQVYKFFKKNKNAKLLIKSYVNSTEGDAYSNAQFIFKQLKKMGIRRSNMIIKSFNQSTFCTNSQKPHCDFLNRKIIFEEIY